MKLEKKLKLKLKLQNNYLFIKYTQMLKPKPEWYVIQLISWTEENVRSSLFQRRESLWMEDHILDVYIPIHEIVTTKKDWSKSVKKKNILPWYILVQMIVTNESWYVVRNTPNVTWFLWAWNIPVPVSWEELEKLKWKVAENAQNYSNEFLIWDLANITGWPFEGNEWKITEINEKKRFS
jgi:transcriptional antiterminator NusG